MLLSKLLIILALVFFATTWGFQPQEAISIGAIILPLFTVYLGIITDNTLESPFENEIEENTVVKKNIVTLVYIIFPLYTVATLGALFVAAVKILPVEPMVGLIESGLGFYVGKIVLTLFKTKNTTT